MNRILFVICFCLLTGSGIAREPIRLASDPALSPDGETLAFSWRGDIWSVAVTGGVAERLTSHSESDGEPAYSPDGKEIAFTSRRKGGPNLYVMSANGGAPTRVTHHSEGCSLQGWYPDGQALLVSAERDHYWRHAERFFRIEKNERVAPQMLFNAYGDDGSLSADGKRLLYTREGERWWRKGYQGSRASQIWLYDLTTDKHTKVVAHQFEARSPLWKPDGNGYYYVGNQGGAFNIWEREAATGKENQITFFEDDSVVDPCISRDGSTIVFRHLFDFYRLTIGKNESPQKIEIIYDGDQYRDKTVRDTLTRATEAAFSKDGLEVAFIAGGDLWVMDTELREPKQITDTPEAESSPVFAPDHDSILFVSGKSGESDIWKATRANAEEYWWQNDDFKLEQLTSDADVESDLKWSPKGDRVAFIKGRGNLWVMKPDGKEAELVLESWDAPQYEWSPDGKWFVYAVSNDNFNNDVWLHPIDGSREPFNLSQHPDNEYYPSWSPDGKIIAFTSRVGDESDIYLVYLQKELFEQSERERKLEAALKKMKGRSAKPEPKEEEPKKGEGKEEKKEAEKKPAEKKPESKDVVIDFDGIHDRIRRIRISDTRESRLFWSHDSKKLAFIASVNGKRGLYTVELPDKLQPKFLSATMGSSPTWIASGNRILWLVGGQPTSTSATGTSTAYSFSTVHRYDVGAKYEATFNVAWRLMRDNWYDPRFNNRNWDEIRRKYAPMAREAVDMRSLATVVSLMLGELNGSHLGFSPSSGSALGRLLGGSRNDVTVHLGVRFDAGHKGPGLLIADVIPNSPASQKKSRLKEGEIILSINEKTVDPGMDLTEVLNGSASEAVELTVKDAKGETREVSLQPTTFRRIRSLLYEDWIRENRKAVEEKSQGKLGYLHIQAMNESSFLRFEKELYEAGYGKDGLIIDVRENGGGSTTDHLLTALTQPAHAITVPRGGGRGYPQDRKVYATWNKPIVVLCNQNSFSNAEIFSHAIKGLKRGQVVGVTTAGGVISTGAARVMDMGRIRIPFRAWFVAWTGEDMELNGAVPHHELWPEPGELPEGIDRQLDKAVEVLTTDVEEWKKRPQVKLRYASERRAK